MIKHLLNLLFPISCAACENLLLINEQVICLQCRIELPTTDQYKHPENEAIQKFYAFPSVINAACFLYYKKKTTTQQIFHNLKYNNQPRISFFLGQLFCEQLAESNMLDAVTEIIPIPLHKNKKHKRGYNQVNGFAKALHLNFCIPINYKVLTKSKNNRSQTKKSHKERLKVTQNDYLLHLKHASTTNHYLLIDDILTTGSTLTSCVQLLSTLPNTKITILCLAMTSQRF